MVFRVALGLQQLYQRKLLEFLDCRSSYLPSGLHTRRPAISTCELKLAQCGAGDLGLFLTLDLRLCWQ